MSFAYGSTAILAEQQTSGTDGGTFTSGARRTRVLNTEVYDPDGIVTISSNQFTLQAGTYEIEAYAPAFAVQRNKLWLRNVTDSSDESIGSSSFYSSVVISSPAKTKTVVTIASAKVFELQHQCASSFITNGLGVASSFDTEQFATVVIREMVATGTAQVTARIADQKTSGTAPQTLTSGAWRTRDLNTEVYDPDGIVTLSSNQFILQAGTYEISASSQLTLSLRAHSRLYNVSDTVSEFVGVSFYTSGANSTGSSLLFGIVTISSAKAFEVQQQITSASCTGGLAGSFDTEQYTTVKIRKIA